MYKSQFEKCTLTTGFVVQGPVLELFLRDHAVTRVKMLKISFDHWNKLDFKIYSIEKSYSKENSKDISEFHGFCCTLDEMQAR